jgi:hypothetical protein
MSPPEVTQLNASPRSVSTIQRHLLRPILIATAVVGTLDMIPAFISFGLTAPQGVAAGLLGRSAAFQGGAVTWMLGMLLHFFIAFTAATIYCLTSRKLGFLANHWVVCGLFYGIAVFLFMNLIVLPISALHLAGPYQLSELLQGIVSNMVVIGLPISFSVHQWGK